MKWFILTDLEGVAGVERWDQTYEDGAHRPEAMRLLGREVAAAVEGIVDADPQATVDVWDGHGPGGLYPEDVKPPAHYLREGDPHGRSTKATRGYSLWASTRWQAPTRRRSATPTAPAPLLIIASTASSPASSARGR